MSTHRGLHAFAVLLAISTLILIFAGGLVTSTGSGLAVPDWPLSFGQVFPEMKGGVAYEHGHRMVASVVGLLTVVLALWILRKEPSRQIRMVAGFAVLAVIGQGLLGGATVLLRLPTLLSVGHAALAQIFFCLTVVLAIITSEKWKEERIEIKAAGIPQVKGLAVVATGTVFIQIILGAMMRHTGGGLSIPDFPLSYGRLIPPFFTGPILFNYTHRIVGLAVIILIVWFFLRLLRLSSIRSDFRMPAYLLLLSLLLQVVLGAVAIWSRKAPVPTTFHVMCGALTLAACLWMTLRVFRIETPDPRIQEAAA